MCFILMLDVIVYIDGNNAFISSHIHLRIYLPRVYQYGIFNRFNMKNEQNEQTVLIQLLSVKCFLLTQGPKA